MSASDQPEIIWFPLPPTMNEIIAAARTSPYNSSRMKKYWTEEASSIAIGHRQFKGKVWMGWVWHIRNLRRDEDNISSSRKYLCDGLVLAGIIKDDSCHVIQTPVIHWHIKDSEDKVMCAIADNPQFLYQWMEANRKLCEAQ